MLTFDLDSRNWRYSKEELDDIRRDLNVKAVERVRKNVEEERVSLKSLAADHDTVLNAFRSAIQSEVMLKYLSECVSSNKRQVPLPRAQCQRPPQFPLLPHLVPPHLPQVQQYPRSST